MTSQSPLSHFFCFYFMTHKSIVVWMKKNLSWILVCQNLTRLSVKHTILLRHNWEGADTAPTACTYPLLNVIFRALYAISAITRCSGSKIFAIVESKKPNFLPPWPTRFNDLISRSTTYQVQLQNWSSRSSKTRFSCNLANISLLWPALYTGRVCYHEYYIIHSSHSRNNDSLYDVILLIVLLY